MVENVDLVTGDQSGELKETAMQHRITHNPFLAGDPDKLTELIVGLMPKTELMTPEEQAAFDKRCAEGEARFGELPAGTYRILEQGGIAGWHLELEIDGEVVVLQEPGSDFATAYAVFNDKKRAEALARAEIARRHGQEAANTAEFRGVWGGKL